MKLKKLLDLLKKSGINTIDTARDYGDSEESIGKCDVSSFNVVTKIGTILGNEDNISNWVELEIESSIKKLRLQKIYGILLHRPHELLLENGDVLYESIMKLKENRLVEKIGVSVYSINDLMNIVDRFNIDIVQLPINIINQEILHSGFLQELKSKNIEIHARSCFLQGLLLMDFNDIPLKFKKWSNIFLDWRDWLDENNINAVQGCLSFINSIDGIDKVVVGVENVNQLKELVDYSNTTKGIKTFPNLSCNDVNLIDPSNWNSL